MKISKGHYAIIKASVENDLDHVYVASTITLRDCWVWSKAKAKKDSVIYFSSQFMQNILHNMQKHGGYSIRLR